MEGFKDHINLFNGYIDNFINDLNDNLVYEPIKYFLKLPSKRVRPILTLISSKLYNDDTCLLYTSPSPRDYAASRMPSSA